MGQIPFLDETVLGLSYPRLHLTSRDRHLEGLEDRFLQMNSKVKYRLDGVHYGFYYASLLLLPTSISSLTIIYFSFVQPT